MEQNKFTNARKKYVVMVDDNFHYMDKDERYKYGEYDTVEEAINECMNIIESSIVYVEGATADELFSTYCMFGEEPYIISDEEVHFNARDYAREYCKLLEINRIPW